MAFIFHNSCKIFSKTNSYSLDRLEKDFTAIANIVKIDVYLWTLEEKRKKIRYMNIIYNKYTCASRL